MIMVGMSSKYRNTALLGSCRVTPSISVSHAVAGVTPPGQGIVPALSRRESRVTEHATLPFCNFLYFLNFRDHPTGRGTPRARCGKISTASRSSPANGTPDQGAARRRRGPASARKAQMTEYQQPLDALVARYANGRSVREIERQNGLAEGALSNFFKLDKRGKIPRLHIMERFASALGASITEVSRAFAAESGVGLDDLSDDERDLIERYRTLPKPTQELMLTFVTLAAQQQGQPQAPPNVRSKSVSSGQTERDHVTTNRK